MQGAACAAPKATVKEGLAIFGALISGTAEAIANSSKIPATNGSTSQDPAALDTSEVDASEVDASDLPLDPDSGLNQSIEKTDEDGHLFSAGRLLDRKSVV